MYGVLMFIYYIPIVSFVYDLRIGKDEGRQWMRLKNTSLSHANYTNRMWHKKKCIQVHDYQICLAMIFDTNHVHGWHQI